MKEELSLVKLFHPVSPIRSVKQFDKDIVAQCKSYYGPYKWPNLWKLEIKKIWPIRLDDNSRRT